VDDTIRAQPMTTLHAPPGDWDQISFDDSPQKIWLPESLDDCLTVLCDRFKQSKSDLVRNALMVHVYGRLVFEQLVANGLWWPTRRTEFPQEGRRKFSLQGSGTVSSNKNLSDAPRPEFIKAFGKSTADIKVWMPFQLVRELSKLAEESGLTFSEYCRRALTAYYLGRTVMDPLLG
jgi:hypothetical protein